MARTIEKLTPAKVQRATKPGLYGDGAGLYLHVGPAAGDKPSARKQTGKPTGKSWVFRFMLQGRARTMGLGPLHTVSLGFARQLAQEARKKALLGTDPIQERDDARDAQRKEMAKQITFKACADKYIAAHKAGWRNSKHADQWSNTLATYVYPIIGSLAVGDIDTGHVTKILQREVKDANGKVIGSLWETRTETAGRVRGRIETILDFGKTQGWRDGENPARWRGHLENVLPRKTKVARVEHHAALPYRDMFEFMKSLRAQEGVAARALEFAILTAARTGEVIGATWSEVDLAAKLWTVAGERMKSGKQHRTPLSARAVEILRSMLPDKGKPGSDAFVFPGGKRGAPLSNMALLMALRRMGRDDLTAHGFRSSFRDWAAERTNYPSEVAEMALAHAVGDKVEAAYRRTDFFEKRRRLAGEWSEFCSKPFAAEGANIVLLRGETAS